MTGAPPLDGGALRLAERRAFFFDLDGTLVDSSEAHRRAFEGMLSELAPELRAGFDYQRFRGRSTRNTVEALGPFGAEMEARMVARKQALYRAAIERGEVRLFEGAQELVAHLVAHGRALWLVTSASRHAAETVLARFGLAESFRGTVGGEEVRHSKPHPAIFELALQRSGVPREAALTVEDAASGAEASRAAGVDVVLVNVLDAIGAVGQRVDEAWRFGTLAAFCDRVRAELP